jgi:hypothetical protein
MYVCMYVCVCVYVCISVDHFTTLSIYGLYRIMDKVALGQVSPSTSVSPASSHSTKWSIFINRRIIDAL